MNDQTLQRIYFREFKAISRAILIYEDINLLINHIVERISKSFGVKGCSIMLFDEREQQLIRVASFGVSQRYLDKGPVFVNEKYSAFVTGEPVFIQDFQNDSRIQYPGEAKREGIVSMLSVPVEYRRVPIGLIRIYHHEKWELNGDDLDSFTLLAIQLGLVIENNGLKNFFEKIKGAMETVPLRMLKGLYHQ
jgi:signal transduction protein with GAF and PtsI domain